MKYTIHDIDLKALVRAVVLQELPKYKSLAQVAAPRSRKSVRAGRKKPTRLDPKLRRALVHDYRGGTTYADLSRHYGVSRGTVSNILTAAGVIGAKRKKGTRGVKTPR